MPPNAGGARPPRPGDDLRTNRRIRVPQVRLILEDGEQIVMDTYDALKKAEDLGLDLVEVSPTARPPVCKIMDYGKFKYQQQKKAAEAKKKQVHVEVKEVKFRPKTDIGDFNTKVNHLRKFLEAGNKGKITVNFRGREIVHQDLGFEVAKRVIEAVKDIAIVDLDIKKEGRAIVVILRPK